MGHTADYHRGQPHAGQILHPFTFAFEREKALRNAGDGHGPRRRLGEAARGELILLRPVVLNRPDQRIVIAFGEEVDAEFPVPLYIS